MTKKAKQAKKNTNPTTIPSKEELQVRAQAKRERRANQGIENLAQRYEVACEKIEDEGLCVMHFRRSIVLTEMEGNPPLGCFDQQEGGMTVVYRQKGSNTFIEIATALCSTEDAYSRKAGIAVAVENFMNQRVIAVPNYGKDDPANVVDFIFRPLVQAEVEIFDAAMLGLHVIQQNGKL